MVTTRFVAQAAASLALAGCLVEAHPMDLNPFTPGGDLIEMGQNHPARSIPLRKGTLATKVAMPTADTIGADKDELAGWLNESTTVIKKATRMLLEGEDREATEQNNKDLQRLEAHFKTKMVINYKELSKYSSSEAKNPPWPSSYWPIYEDGINYVWNPADPMPASEKYARAFGQDPKQFVKKVSETNGVLGQADRQACTTDADCAPLKDGSGCAKVKGETKGYCIPKWFGICHAWSPAAIEEREPRCAVTKNGIKFEPLDIKALITQAYDGSHLETIFTGTRFNGADEPLNMDEDGRFIDATRRDLGPGYFHIAIHNIMGINKKSFIIDVTAGAEVWNQPVRSYEVISATEMTPEFAAQTFFAPRKTYVFNKDAKSIVFMQLKFSWVVESNDNGPQLPLIDQFTQSAYYEYLLELDDKGDIIGGEWVRNSRKEHPDFLWFPKGQPAIESVGDIGIKYKEVRELLDASADCKQIPTNGTLAPPTNAPEITAPPPTTPPPTTPAPPKPDQGNEADGGSGTGSKHGSVGKDEDDDDDDITPGGGNTVPKPSGAPSTTTKKPATPTPSATPKPPPAIVPVPTPAPIPSKVPEGKGTVAPLVPAPPTTAPPPVMTTLAPTPAPVPNDDDDDDADADADSKPSTLPPKPATTPAATPAASKKSKCRAE